MTRFLFAGLLGWGVACSGNVSREDSRGTALSQGPATATTGESTDRIVGGSVFAGLPAVGAITNQGYQHCTGTLIEKRKVVTAAHCLEDVSASEMRFVIGPSLDKAQAAVPVASIHPHPGFANLRNDIGLMILAEDAPVAPMRVLQGMDQGFIGKSFFFVGYGNTTGGWNGGGSGTKRAVWMEIDRVDDTTFRYDDRTKNTCNGDSGGPAFFQDENGEYLVAGVTSYGDVGCNVYGVDTRVDAYADFLDLRNGQPEPVAGCGQTTWYGNCEGNTLVYCNDERVERVSCAEYGLTCGLKDQASGFDCLDAPPADPCQGESWYGRCDGETLVYCQDDQLKTIACGDYERSCGLKDETYGHDCLKRQAADPCHGETYQGRCEEGLVIWCEQGTVHATDCEARGKTCGFSSAAGVNDCR